MTLRKAKFCCPFDPKISLTEMPQFVRRSEAQFW